MDYDFINSLKLKYYKKDQLQGKCPYCGDTKKENHFGLTFKSTIPTFHCFRCGSSGSVFTLCKDFKINPHIFMYYISNLFKDKVNINVIEDTFKSNELIPLTNDISNHKYYEYLKNRKININFKLDSINLLYKHTKYQNFLFFYFKDQSKIIGRNILPNPDFRYLIFNNSNLSAPYVSSECFNNINKTIPLKIYITEGLFDMFSVFERYPKDNILVYCLLSNFIHKEMVDDIIYLSKKYDIVSIYLALDKDTSIFKSFEFNKFGLKNFMYLVSNVNTDYYYLNFNTSDREKDLNDLLLNDKMFDFKILDLYKLYQKYIVYKNLYKN